jgi:hypothetical protein
MTLSLAYGASEAQMRAIVDGIEQVLRAHPLVWTDAAVAKLAALNPATIEVEILCWFATADFDAYRAARQDVLLGILRVVEANGARLAGAPPPPLPAPPPAVPAR